jgi:hypothetical protein
MPDRNGAKNVPCAEKQLNFHGINALGVIQICTLGQIKPPG